MTAEMSIQVKSIIFAVFVLMFIALLVSFIRGRKLRESYAIVWLGLAAFMLLVTLLLPVVLWLAKLTGIYYLTLIIGSVLFFFLLALLQISLINSTHSDSLCRLSQEISLLKQKLEAQEQGKEADQAEKAQEDVSSKEG